MIPPDQGPLLTHYTRLALQRIDQLEAALKISEAKLRASDAMLRDTQQRLLGLTREIKVARKQVLSTVPACPVVAPWPYPLRFGAGFQPGVVQYGIV